MKSLCIYHSRDLDGYTSAAIVAKAIPGIELMGYDYGQPFDMKILLGVDQLVMTDVSMPMPMMAEIAKNVNSFIWIDHHKSAREEYEHYIEVNGRIGNLTAWLHDGIAACEIAWVHLFSDEPMPLSVLLLGEYDTWRNQDKIRWERLILPFQFGMRLICSSPEQFPQSLLSEDTEYTNDIIGEGKTVLKYLEQSNAKACKSSGFECTFKGLRAVCLNGGGFNSDVFKSVYDPNKHDLMMPFQFNGKFWTISLYTTKDEIDCSALAKQMGGGGHRKAAGFQINDIDKIFPTTTTRWSEK